MVTVREAMVIPAPAPTLTHVSSVREPWGAALRSILFILILLLAWASVDPFEDLADPRLIVVRDTSVVLNQIAYLMLGGMAAFFCLLEPLALRPLLRPIYAATIGWFLVSMGTSDNPQLSAKHVVFAVLVVVLAAAVPMLPINRQRFIDLLTAVTVTVLILCFVGVLLIPNFSIHQPYDMVELGLAGNWRGLFSHKNIAGPMMVIFVFIGIFVANTHHAILGWSIMIAAGIFLLCTGAKTATALLPLVLILSWACLRVRSMALRGVLLLTLLVGLNCFTVGSLYSGLAKSINQSVLPDPTFTGRTDIWQFAIDGIVERPVFGFGLRSFWQREETVGGPSLEWEGPESASHAHNSFLDLALTTGIPGLILGLLWTVALPIRDLHRSIENQADQDLTKLFLRIWLLGLYCCPFESLIFAGNNPIWFSMLTAMFGLRYLSIGRSIR